MPHALTLDANFRLDGMTVERDPIGYEVRVVQPVLRTDGLRPDSVDVLSIVVALQSGGAAEWATTKSYDALWAYLKVVVPKLKTQPRRILVEIKGGDGMERVRAEVVEPDSLGELEVQLKREICGISETHAISVSRKN